MILVSFGLFQTGSELCIWGDWWRKQQQNGCFEHPLHPYTKTLLAAVPDPYITGRKFQALDGEQPVRTEGFQGCAFRSRCPYATKKCAEEAPQFCEVESGHKAACHYIKNK